MAVHETTAPRSRHEIGKATLGPFGTDRPRAGTRRGALSARRRALLLPTGVLLAFTTGCASEDLPTLGMPARDVTDQAPRVLSLWQGSWIAAFAVGAVVWGLILWAVVFYRRRSGETGLPVQTRYNLPLEVLYTAIPLVMVAVFFFFTARDEERILAVSDNPDHRVTVTGLQWSWQFTYDSDGGEDATLTGTPAKPPTLVLPQGETVQFRLVSNDVIHSFWVPAFLFKQDVIPGRVNTFEIKPQKIGTYAGKCAELCGKDHSRMLFNVEIVSPDEYQSYVDQLSSGSAQ